MSVLNRDRRGSDAFFEPRPLRGSDNLASGPALASAGAEPVGLRAPQGAPASANDADVDEQESGGDERERQGRAGDDE